MPGTWRRAAGVSIALAIIVICAAMRPTVEAERTFRITFGLKDARPTQWDARITVASGDVTSLSGWRFEEDDETTGTAGWKSWTHEYPKPRAELSPVYPTGLEPPQPTAVWPNGVLLTVRGENPTLTIAFQQGKVGFAADMEFGTSRNFLNGQVQVQREPEISVLRPPEPGRSENSRQDDYPDFCVSRRDDRQFLAWVSYDHRADRILLAQRHGPSGAWSDPILVDGPGDHFRVAIAETANGTLWITWAQQIEHEWVLRSRPYFEGKLGVSQTLSEAPGPNLWQRMTRDRLGRVWLVWQCFHNRQSDILVRCADGDGWKPIVRASGAPVHNWDPCITADPREDRVWIGWDSYETGSYGVRVRAISGGPGGTLDAILTPRPSTRFQAHISLTCDRAGRLWAAWDESASQWGKDYGLFYHDSGGTRLYESRQIIVRCLDHGQWRACATELKLPELENRFAELPRLQADASGRIWMTYRKRTSKNQRADGWANRGRWDIDATAWLGDRWLTPVELRESSGRNDMRTASDVDREGNVYFAYASDNRGWLPPQMLPRNHSVAVSRLQSSLVSAAHIFVKPSEKDEAEHIVHPREAKDVARVRNYQIHQAGKTYHIYRGDLHRHTDISGDGIGDGSLMDLYRYGHDAAALDFVMVTDHNMGQDNEYCWWRTQQSNDAYTVPGTFLVLYGYERSVPFPQGHRNIIWTERGHRTLRLPNNPARRASDTARVYEHVKETNGICTSHTSATQQGTDWREHDDNLEPIVEIFQGEQASYESPDGPRTIDDDMLQVHGPFHPEGLVSVALAKGYRLGFQASSDHTSTHVGYTCVIADEFTRRGLVRALKERHCYAATDNIVLDVRMDDRAIMGDVIQSPNPHLKVNVLGTGPIDRVEVLRNGDREYTFQPVGDSVTVKFSWQDLSPPRRDAANYYYVRVIQKNRQLAWSSPIWVK